MSHIDSRLDLDNAVRQFVDKEIDSNDYVLYFRHSFKDGEGVMYSSHPDVEDEIQIPSIGDDVEAAYGDPNMYIKFKEAVLSLALGICQQDKKVRKLFIQVLKNGSGR